MFPRRLVRLCAACAGALAASIVTTQPGATQGITGSVHDSATAAPIEGATVSQLRSEESVGSVSTDGSGRFKLRLIGDAPYEVLIQRLGYAARRIVLGAAELAAGTVTVRLVPQAVMLPELGAHTDRERLEFPLGTLLIREDGVFVRNRLYRGCYYLALDSIVIRDPRLLRPELMRQYTPARLLYLERTNSLASGFRSFPSKDLIPDPRLRRDAWPCNIATFVIGPDHTMSRLSGTRVDLPSRGLPGPDASRYDLISEAEYLLAHGMPGGSTTAAVAPEHGAAFATSSAPVIQRLHSDGGLEARVDLSDAPASLRGITRMGWLGDTLWAADAATRRVVLLAAGAAPIVREPRVANAFTDLIDGAPTDRFDPDLRAPIPMAGGRWLSVQLAPAAPFPPRVQEEPARRRLAVLNADGGLEHVLTTLRPGPWRMDLGIPDTPAEPFRDHPLYAIGPAGDHVTIVHRAFEVAVWLDIYTVTRIGLEGDTLFHVERRAPLIPISDDAFSAAAKELASHPSVAQALGPQPALRQAIVEAMLYRSKYHPPITDVVVGHDGSTWMRWPDAGNATVRWDVLDASGRPIRTIDADRNLKIITASGPRVWGLLPDGKAGTRLIRYTLRSAN